MSYKPLRDAQWSRGEHRCCQGCSTTERPHLARGYCRPCYCALPDVIAARRDAQARYRKTDKAAESRKRHDAARKTSTTRAAWKQDYYGRPEVIERLRQWYAQPEIKARRRAYAHERRVVERAGDLSADAELALRRSTKRCPLCRVVLTDQKHRPNSRHLDHIVPVNQGGRHTPANVRIICADCNKRRPRDGRDFAGQLRLGMVAC